MEKISGTELNKLSKAAIIAVNMNYTKLKNGTGYAAGYNVYKTNSTLGSVVIFGNPISSVVNAK